MFVDAIRTKITIIEHELFTKNSDFEKLKCIIRTIFESATDSERSLKDRVLSVLSKVTGNRDFSSFKAEEIYQRLSIDELILQVGKQRFSEDQWQGIQKLHIEHMREKLKNFSFSELMAPFEEEQEMEFLLLDSKGNLLSGKSALCIVFSEEELKEKFDKEFKGVERAEIERRFPYMEYFGFSFLLSEVKS